MGSVSAKADTWHKVSRKGDFNRREYLLP